MGRGDRGGSRVTENEKWISVSVGCHNFSLLRFRLHLDATPPLSPPSRLFLDFSPLRPIHFHSFAWAALTRIHHLAFSSVLFSVFPLCLGLNPCSPASVYLINYFKDFRPFSALPLEFN